MTTYLIRKGTTALIYLTQPENNNSRFMKGQIGQSSRDPIK
jgi:hypothetical protein